MILDSIEFRIVTRRLREERNRISTQRNIFEAQARCKICGALWAERWSLGSLVTVEKDLRCVTGLSYIQTAFRPCDSESTQR